MTLLLLPTFQLKLGLKLLKGIVFLDKFHQNKHISEPMGLIFLQIIFYDITL